MVAGAENSPRVAQHNRAPDIDRAAITGDQTGSKISQGTRTKTIDKLNRVKAAGDAARVVHRGLGLRANGGLIRGNKTTEDIVDNNPVRPDGNINRIACPA